MNLWEKAITWLDNANDPKLTQPDLWVLAMAYLVVNFRQQENEAKFLRAWLLAEQKLDRLHDRRIPKESPINDVVVALGLPFYRDEKLVTTEPEDMWRPAGKSNVDGDGRFAHDAAPCSNAETLHPCRASCPFACHKAWHDAEQKGCLHFAVHSELVNKVSPVEDVFETALAVFGGSEERAARFVNWETDYKTARSKNEALPVHIGRQTLHSLEKERTRERTRMISIHWNEIATWIDDRLPLSNLKRASGNISECDVLRNCRLCRDLAIDA